MLLLYSIISICILIFLLCSIIVLSEKLLGFSGEVEVNVNSEKSFKAKKGVKLLPALAENNIYLPAACGSKGNCGRCRLKVISGGGYPTALEKIALSEKELEEGLRLACQVKLRENINLDIPKELLNARNFNAKLIEIKDLAFKIKGLRFKLEDGEKLNFEAGQYIQITRELPRENAVRAYSISSSPNIKDEFTLDVQLIEGGLMSSYLHSLKINTIISFCGSFGDMYVNSENKFDNILLVAGGVGLAPMRSIISYLIDNSSKSKIILFHGVRSKKNLYCENEYKKLQKDYSNFEYYPVLSEPALEDGWIGKTGLVTQALEEYLNEKKLFNESLQAYLCGPSKMMEATTKLLIEKGVESNRIHSDPFSF